MIIPPFTDESFDEVSRLCFAAMTDSMKKKDDDGFIVCGGRRGTGKTSLLFHAYNQYAGEEMSITQVAFNQREMSISLDNASKSSGKRFVGYDEANVNKRDALTRWNKKLMDTYMNIRGLNIFHWWNNPSLAMLDKPFIEECVKGVIFILTKDPTKPRLFYYFTQEGILRFLEEQGNLKARTIQTKGHMYAHHLGWFRRYDGLLWPEYLEKKKNRMTDKVSDLRDEFAPVDKLSLSAYAKKVGMHKDTVKRMVLYGLDAGLLKLGIHVSQTGTGAYKILGDDGVRELDYLRSTKEYTIKWGKVSPGKGVANG